jgi:hypothetical protein
MMKLNKLLILIGAIYLLSACVGTTKNQKPKKDSRATTEHTADFNPAFAKLVEEDEAGNYSFWVEEEVLKQSAMQADLSIAEISNLEIMKADFQAIYIIFNAKDTANNTIKKALYVRQNKDGIYQLNSKLQTPYTVSQVCVGSCCTACDFRIRENKIYGCDCKQECAEALEDAPGYCHHSISTDWGMILREVD